MSNSGFLRTAVVAVITASMLLTGASATAAPTGADAVAKATSTGRVLDGTGLETLALTAGATTASGLTVRATRCPSAITGSTNKAPGRVSPQGVKGTTSADLAAFAKRFNAIRVAKCLPPVPFKNIRYDSCMEKRLFWMAEDPSTNPMSAWGHRNQAKRSDGVPDRGCDGNLAGGSGNTGATVASKWWNSAGHRASLYKPTIKTSMAKTCILFAMTHGGVPNEPYSFTRAAARWVTCP